MYIEPVPMRDRPLRLLCIAVACAAATLVGIAPASAQQPPPRPATPPAFSPYWVTVTSRISLYSGPEADAAVFGEAPLGSLLQVVSGPQGRVRVLNPLNNGFAWVDPAFTEKVDDPSPDEIARFASFEPWWAMTHRPAPAWATEMPDADQFGTVPMWRYLQIVSPQYGSRVLTLDPRNNAQAFVDVDNIGPVGAPPTEYFDNPPPDEEVIGLPGRIVRETDWFERPVLADYFSVERFQINQPVRVEGLITTDEGSWYRTGQDQYVPSRAVRLPPPTDRTFPGRWIDATISEPVMVTAYENDRPIHAALAVKGRTAFETPTGVFRIWRRVANETMDSLTLGIPRESREGYFLKDVLFTQYFTGDGAALHYNYWRSDWGSAGSHGCLGMNYDDSLFFWEFADVGTPVYIHQ
jgi:hypothetical protein